MEKRCFIIMPTGDQDGYAKGHFNRVYQYIIVPACKAVEFKPVKADDPSLNEAGLEIVKSIIDSDIAICDVSSKNSNALYGFSVRQAIGLPVVLIKDQKTKILFETQEFGGLEYDESLRIDTVEVEIETLSNALKNAFAKKAAINPLLSRLGIGVPKMTVEAEKSTDSTEEDEKVKEIHLPVISPLPDFVGDPIQHEEIEKLKVGDSLFHMNYGRGEVKSIKKLGRDKMADIHFGSESKLLVLVTTGVFRKIKA